MCTSVSPWPLILAIVGLTATLLSWLGFFRIRFRRNELRDRLEFAREFLAKFQSLVSGGEFNGAAYAWLLRNTARLQGYVDRRVSFSYKPPFANYIIPHYQVVANTIPQIRTGQAHPNDLATVEDCIFMLIGHLEAGLDALEQGLGHPWHWLSVGTTSVLEAPVQALGALGVIRQGAVEKAAGSRIYRLVALIGLIVSILAGLVQVLSGWETVLSLLP